jgi:acetylornithine deacetylase/succinyl-diaminopimelate desuccinylase-like protein
MASDRQPSQFAQQIHGANGAIEPVELLRALLHFDTSNPPGNERPCMEFVASLLSDHGVEPRLVAREPERPNLIARLSGHGDAPPLLLYGHVDVVPARVDEWRYPPFAGELVDGEVWGRGALDMKGGVAMLVAAFLRAATEPLEPAGDLVLALACDEETGSELGAKYLVEEHPELFNGVRYALSEIGGFTEWVGGRRLYPIQVAEKQRCLIRATIRGQGGHPSTVVRDTASMKLGTLLTTLAKRRLPVHVVPVVRGMLGAMAGALPSHQRAALRPLTVPALTDRLLDLFGKDAESLDPLLHNTATPTVVRGGESTNVIPTEITVDLDGRVLPGQTPHDLLRELEALAPDLAEFEIVREEPSVPADPNLALYPMLAAIIRERDPGGTPMPTLIPGYTDARHFARLGIQTYGFLPMLLPPHITTALIHAPDERVPAEAIEFGADCVFEAIRRYSTSTARQ